MERERNADESQDAQRHEQDAQHHPYTDEVSEEE